MNNPTLKTFFLFGVLSALFIALGLVIGGPRYAIGFFVISVIINLAMYWFSDKIAIAMAGAKLIDEKQAPEIYADIKELVQKMRIPMPKLYISPQAQPNAFATGRDPSHSVVAITQGLLQNLPRNEVKAVLAHELGHIKNRDVLTATIAAVMASAISNIAQIGFYASAAQDDEGNSNPIASILFAIFAPIAAFLIQMAISRQREFGADEAAAKATGAPQDLANALMRIEQAVQQIPMNVNPAMASLYIECPIPLRGLMELMSTHPNTAKRVERLMAMSTK